MLPACLSLKNPEVNLEVDTVNNALIECVSEAGVIPTIHIIPLVI